MSSQLEFPIAILSSRQIKEARLATAFLFIVMSLYCVVGFTGFDPARQDEAYIFGIILEYLRGQSWVVPQLAGEPYLEKPPLYYLIGAESAQLFADVLPLHDAARLASAFFVSLTLVGLAAAGRLLWGTGYGRFCALALLCSLGLAVPSHMMLTDNAQLTGIALAILGYAGIARGCRWGGWILGTGAGVAFLSKGLLGPGVIAIGGLLLLCFPSWRNRHYFIALIFSAVAALPWLGIWPYLLYCKSPDLFGQWFSQNNFGRFLGYAPAYLNAVKDTKFWYTTFLWASFPVLPLAALSLKRYRAHWQVQPALQIGLTLSAALLVTLMASSTLRAIYALPLLLMLSLMAAPILKNPPAWMKCFGCISSWILFATLGLILWLGWGALIGGILPSAWRAQIIPDKQLPTVNTLTVGGAIAISIGWILCQWYWRNQTWRVGAAWYSMLFSTLAIFALLWLPLLDQKNSYRALFEELSDVLPDEGCVSSLGLGESQRGMLDYITGVQTLGEANGNNARCNALLIDGKTGDQLPLLSEDWIFTWTGKRSPDSHEQFWLYRRKQPDMDASEFASRQRQHAKHRLGFNRHLRMKA